MPISSFESTLIHKTKMPYKRSCISSATYFYFVLSEKESDICCLCLKKYA